MHVGLEAGKKLCADVPGADTGHGHTTCFLLPQLSTQGLGKYGRSRLGGAVVGHDWKSSKGTDRGDGHNEAIVVLNHPWKECLSGLMDKQEEAIGTYIICTCAYANNHILVTQYTQDL